MVHYLYNVFMRYKIIILLLLLASFIMYKYQDGRLDDLKLACNTMNQISFSKMVDYECKLQGKEPDCQLDESILIKLSDEQNRLTNLCNI